MYEVYILYAMEFGKYYIGQTSNLEQRIIQHNESEELSFTSKYRPWSLYAVMGFKSRSIAMKVERYLKKKPRAFILRLKEDVNLRAYISERFDTE